MKQEKSAKFDLYSLKKILIAILCLLIAFGMNRLGIGCIFLKLFGIPCPGCGMTRAVIALLKGNFSSALQYNPMVLSLPILGIYFITDGNLFGKKADRFVICVILAGFLINWVCKLLFNIM